MQKIEIVIQHAGEELMRLEGVEGVGRGKTSDNEDCILVFVSGDATAMRKNLPSNYKGYPLVIQHSGIIDAQ